MLTGLSTISLLRVTFVPLIIMLNDANSAVYQKESEKVFR